LSRVIPQSEIRGHRIRISRDEAAMTTPDDRTPLLTPPQANHFLAGFRQIDRLLCSIEEVVQGEEGGLFPRIAPDLTGRQKDLLMSFAAAMRKSMAHILESHEVAIPEARTSASHAVRSALTFIDIALSDLRPKVMRGYGEVSEEATEALHRIVTELRRLQGSTLRDLNSEPRDQEPK
jgi:hypothetical protein